MIFGGIVLHWKRYINILEYINIRIDKYQDSLRDVISIAYTDKLIVWIFIIL